MTVREWMDINLPKVHADKKLYKTYRRIMSNWHSARMYAAPDSTVLDADIERYLDDDNYQPEDTS